MSLSEQKVKDDIDDAVDRVKLLMVGISGVFAQSLNCKTRRAECGSFEIAGDVAEFTLNLELGGTATVGKIDHTDSLHPTFGKINFTSMSSRRMRYKDDLNPFTPRLSATKDDPVDNTDISIVDGDPFGHGIDMESARASISAGYVASLIKRIDFG